MNSRIKFKDQHVFILICAIEESMRDGDGDYEDKKKSRIKI